MCAEKAEINALLAYLNAKIDHGVVEIVPISRIVPRRCLRSIDPNTDYIKSLAWDDVTVPPIIVQKSTMMVVDGMCRFQAAVLRGDKDVAVQYFDGSDREAFAVALRLNSVHGLALSQAERNAGAEHLIKVWPEWSDRTIAFFSGVSPKTVAACRRRVDAGGPGHHLRTGRDGKVRPLSTADRRRQAFQLFSSDPSISLRRVAAQTGISVGTARDVRQRYDAGRDPVPSRQLTANPGHGNTGVRPVPATYRTRSAPEVNSLTGRTDILRQLRIDPTLRFSRPGRLVLRLLEPVSWHPDTWTTLVSIVPPHTRGLVANVANECAGLWLRFASELRRAAQAPIQHIGTCDQASSTETRAQSIGSG